MYACSDDTNLITEKSALIPIYENGEIIGYDNISNFRTATNEEMQSFIEKGWMSELETRANKCEWSDGVAGSIECNGGSCGVVHHTNPNGTQSIGLACYKNGEISHAGAFR